MIENIMESSGKSSSSSSSYSYMWSCGMASPSWFPPPPHCQPSSGIFHVLGTTTTSTTGHSREVVEEETSIDVYCRSSSRRWRQVLKGLLREGRKLKRRKRSLMCSTCNHSSPTTTTTANNFGYDAVSYAKNFDDGLLDDEDYHHSYYFSSTNNARSSSGNHAC